THTHKLIYKHRLSHPFLHTKHIIHTHRHTHLYTNTDKVIHTYTQKLLYTHTHTHTHTHTDTHTKASCSLKIIAVYKMTLWSYFPPLFTSLLFLLFLSLVLSLSHPNQSLPISPFPPT